MPWLAERDRDGECISPHEATRTDTLSCRHCGKQLYVRAAHTRGDGVFVARLSLGLDPVVGRPDP